MKIILLFQMNRINRIERFENFEFCIRMCLCVYCSEMNEFEYKQ